MNKLAYGFDFGTTNSAIAVHDGEKVTILPIGYGGAVTERTVLFFPSEQREFYVGNEAVFRYFDEDMHGRFMQSIKSLLPDINFQGTNILGWGSRGADDLAAFVISELRRRANRLVGQEVDIAVFGKPVYFSDDQEEEEVATARLIAAAKKAGFNQVYLQLEPIAAALHYESCLDREEIVLVADLGGGTSDFTLMRLSPGRKNKRERNDDVLATRGVHIGGDDLDSRIMSGKLLGYFGKGSTYRSGQKMLDMPKQLLIGICRWQQIPFLKERFARNMIRELLHFSSDKPSIKRLQVLIEENLGFALFQAIEKAKIGLTTRENEQIRFAASTIDINEGVSREEFTSLISGNLDRLGKCLVLLLQDGGVESREVDSVFATGGTSLVPGVQNLLADKFGRDKIKRGEDFTSVVSGLALSVRLFV